VSKVLRLVGLGSIVLGFGALLALLLPGVRDSLATNVSGSYGQPVQHPLAVAVMIGAAFVGVGWFITDFGRRLGAMEVRADDEGLHVRNEYSSRDLNWSQIESFGTDRLRGRGAPHLVRLRDGSALRLAALGQGKEGTQLLQHLEAELRQRRGTR
jgi:hypothetical protein